MKIRLLGKNPEELKTVAQEAGLPKFAAGQMAQWLYAKKVRSIDEMTNISKEGRARLAERYEVGVTEYSGLQVSSDGTKKYLFPVTASHSKGLDAGAVHPGAGENGAQAHDEPSDRALESGAVEAVMIPDKERATLCVSSQSGCRMGCRFCMTGRQGFHGHLSVADIMSQFLAVDETLSTIGVIPALKRFLDENRCHLAVSLHNPFSDERLSMMPVEKAWPIRDVVDLIRQYDFTGQRRVSFEYTMFSGFNDTKRHADALTRLLAGLECRVNLIKFHKIPDFPYVSSPDAVMENFRDRLGRAGITATIRASRGEDILAACGMLAGKHNGK